MRILTVSGLFAAAAGLLLLSCRDVARDNPFDPNTEVLLVHVLEPEDSSVWTAGDTISFRAEAFTGFDGLPVQQGSWAWSSNIRGNLAADSAFSSDSLPVGNHLVSARVRDNAGRVGEATVRVFVRPVPEFGVRITHPPDTVFVIGSGFVPVAVEYLPPGVEVIGRFWSFGAGSGIASTTEPSPGMVVYDQPGDFRLIYQIADDRGRVTADTVRVQVLEKSDPAVVRIASPQADTTIVRGDSLYLDAVEVETSARISDRRWIYPPQSGLNALYDTTATVGWKVFGNPGVFEVVYRVTDLLGVPAADTVIVTVNDTLPAPQATIVRPAAADTAIVNGDSIYFEAFVLPAGAETISHVWDFGETSGIDPRFDSTRVAGWRGFTANGEHMVKFTATDLSGRSSRDSMTVTVSANQPPTASITEPAGAAIGVGLGQAVTFRATDSDPEGRPLIRYWSWGQGSGITPSAADSTADPGSRVFGTAGTFTVRYSVIDDKGLTALDSVVVTVTQNELPSAQITAPSADTTIYAWTGITFRGSDSDGDGTVIRRRWIYPAGSGLSGMEDSLAVTPARTFTAAGTFPVIYTVTDDMLGTGRDTVTVTVLANSRPQAAIISPAGQVSITAGDSVSFIAMDSDPDGSIATRHWTYGEGSGIADDYTAIPDYRTFANAGNFFVIYTVSDNRGAESSDSVQVNVSP